MRYEASLTDVKKIMIGEDVTQLMEGMCCRLIFLLSLRAGQAASRDCRRTVSVEHLLYAIRERDDLDLLADVANQFQSEGRGHKRQREE